jgi:hypothetical protein
MNKLEDAIQNITDLYTTVMETTDSIYKLVFDGKGRQFTAYRNGLQITPKGSTHLFYLWILKNITDPMIRHCLFNEMYALCRID